MFIFDRSFIVQRQLCCRSCRVAAPFRHTCQRRCRYYIIRFRVGIVFISFILLLEHLICMIFRVISNKCFCRQTFYPRYIPTQRGGCLNLQVFGTTISAIFLRTFYQSIFFIIILIAQIIGITIGINFINRNLCRNSIENFTGIISRSILVVIISSYLEFGSQLIGYFCRNIRSQIITFIIQRIRFPQSFFRVITDTIEILYPIISSRYIHIYLPLRYRRTNNLIEPIDISIRRSRSYQTRIVSRNCFSSIGHRFIIKFHITISIYGFREFGNILYTV